MKLFDEIYAITKDYMLTGLYCGEFSGERGVHEPRKVLDGHIWEAHMLERDPAKRKKQRDEPKTLKK